MDYGAILADASTRARGKTSGEVPSHKREYQIAAPEACYTFKVMLTNVKGIIILCVELQVFNVRLLS